MEELKQNNIQVRFLGEIERFPSDTQNVILSAVEQTSNNTGLILCLAVNYGGRREIITGNRNFTYGFCALFMSGWGEEAKIAIRNIRRDAANAGFLRPFYVRLCAAGLFFWPNVRYRP